MSVVGWILLQKSKVASVRIFGSGVRWRHPGSVRPGYHPSPMLKLYIYGYLNRVQSSRRLEREAARIDTRPDTAKIGSGGRVEVQRARLRAVFGGRKTFPHVLDPLRTWRLWAFPTQPTFVGSSCISLSAARGHAAGRAPRSGFRCAISAFSVAAAIVCLERVFCEADVPTPALDLSQV